MDTLKKTAVGKHLDMTTGPIMRKVLLFAIPMVIGDILQQLYTTVDTLVISKYCDYTALAAVGTSTQPVEVVLCLFLGIGKGVSILVSQYEGADEHKRIQDVCRAAVTFVYLCGIPVGLIGILCTPWILRIMGVPADTWDAAVTYTRIVFCGTLGNIGYNMNAGILRGMGDSKASLWFLVVSCISNIVLDLAFVTGFGMDAGGVALATSIAMYISWLISVVYIRKKYPELDFTFLPKHFSGEEMKRVVGIGIPIGLNTSLYSFGHMAMQTFVNAQGSVFMAGASVSGRITNLTNVAVNALSSAATTYSGQNYGAQKYDRLRQGFLRIPLVSGTITLTFGFALLLIRTPLLLFFNQDPQVLIYAERYVVILLLSQWVFAIFNAITCFVNGVGKVRNTMVVNLLMLWAVRIPAAYIIHRFFDGTYVMVSIPISFCFGLVCMVGYSLFSPAWKELIGKPVAAKTDIIEQQETRHEFWNHWIRHHRPNTHASH